MGPITQDPRDVAADQITELHQRASAQLDLAKAAQRRIKDAARRGDHAAMMTHAARVAGHQDNADAAHAAIRRLLDEGNGHV